MTSDGVIFTGTLPDVLTHIREHFERAAYREEVWFRPSYMRGGPVAYSLDKHGQIYLRVWGAMVATAAAMPLVGDLTGNWDVVFADAVRKIGDFQSQGDA